MESEAKEKPSILEKDTEDSKATSLAEKTPVEEEDDGEQHHMSGAKLHVLIFGLGIAMFLMALDMSILSTAIPIITEKFNSTEDIGWYMSSYLLTLYVFFAHFNHEGY